MYDEASGPSDETINNKPPVKKLSFPQPKSSKQSNQGHEALMTNIAYRPRCSECALTFCNMKSLDRHNREIHLYVQPYYCLWPGCNFGPSGLPDKVRDHVRRVHLNENDQNVANFVGEYNVNTKSSRSRRAPLYSSTRNNYSNLLYSK